MLNVTSRSIYRCIYLPIIILLSGSTLLNACDEHSEQQGGDTHQASLETSSDTEHQKDQSSKKTENNAVDRSSIQDVQSPTNSGAILARTDESPSKVYEKEPSTAPSSEPTDFVDAGPGDEEPIPYNPATFDALLKSNVANGKVNYSGFNGSDEFAQFISSIKTTDISTMSTDEQLAFWINAYNGLVITNVNNNPGIKQPLDVKGFFDKKKFTAANKSVTLNDIENNIIRPTFKEPLIHFGLVCAAVSCPPLISTAYTGTNVRSQLAENARAYLANAKQNRWDAKKKTLYLSKIFEWYKVDFGDNDAGLIAFAKEYGPEEMKSGLESTSNVKVKFLEYDWTLNKK